VTVTCTAGTGDADITVVAGTGTKTFTSANFATPQNVTLAAAEDADQANGQRTITCASTGLASVNVTATEMDNDAAQNVYLTEFQVQYDKIKNPANGYFSPEGIPYHSAETLPGRGPGPRPRDDLEAFSFWMWLEAEFGRMTGNWAPFNNAWSITEQFIIPTQAGQPGGRRRTTRADPADYAPEFNQPSQYPSPLSTSVIAGSDPLAGELQTTYGNRFMYAMHWIIDVDNTYGFGNGRGASLTECGDSTPRVTYMNTYQRGPQESVWETVPHPSCDTQRFGQPGAGFPPLFIQGSTGNQWRYTDAPDADARAVQAAYWALTWATAQNNQSQISASVAKAAKMGDFLRYAFYDKYFKNPGCTNTGCTPGSGKSSSSGLLSWYFAWGGAWTTPGRGGSVPATPTAATRTRGGVGDVGRAGSAAPAVTDRERGLGGQPDPPDPVLHLAAVGRGRHRRRCDEQLGRRVRAAAGGNADVLRHGLPGRAGLRRPAVEPVVRVPGVGHAAHGRAVQRDRQRAGQGGARQVGQLGHLEHHARHRQHLRHPERAGLERRTVGQLQQHDRDAGGQPGPARDRPQHRAGRRRGGGVHPYADPVRGA
jgi:hypothetical protein